MFLGYSLLFSWFVRNVAQSSQNGVHVITSSPIRGLNKVGKMDLKDLKFVQVKPRI